MEIFKIHSLTEMIEATTTILTFIILVSNFILMLSMWADKAKIPEKNQNERIAKLETKVDELCSRREKDAIRIAELEKGNVVTQKAILALLSHAIDGNNIDGLVNARDGLQDYLTTKAIIV